MAVNPLDHVTFTDWVSKRMALVTRRDKRKTANMAEDG